MTSSLVGSEMCIRDRLSDLAKRTKDKSSQPNQNVPIEDGVAKNTASPYICLLYTSDAADDM
eukprot:2776523-Prorocentrum_lima.AAC.1